jgi:hypothetical protein
LDLLYFARLLPHTRSAIPTFVHESPTSNSAEDEERMMGTIMVESEETNAKLDKANLIITAKTLIFKEQDGKRVRATFEDFKMGQLIEAQFVDGPTVMIYPLQVAAAEIVILNNVKEE